MSSASSSQRREIVAEGVWCHNCEFFEVADFGDDLESNCLACGCAQSDHADAEVVTIKS